MRDILPSSVWGDTRSEQVKQCLTGTNFCQANRRPQRQIWQIFSGELQLSGDSDLFSTIADKKKNCNFKISDFTLKIVIFCTVPVRISLLHVKSHFLIFFLLVAKYSTCIIFVTKNTRLLSSHLGIWWWCAKDVSCRYIYIKGHKRLWSTDGD